MGTYLTGTYSVIHTDTTADFDNFVYSAVYFTKTFATYQINDTIVAGFEGETLDIIVQAPTATTLDAGFLLLGNAKPVGLFRTGLVTTTGGTTGGEQWQFVNIKTGLPTNG